MCADINWWEGKYIATHYQALALIQVASQHEVWDGRLPVLQAEGPRLEPVAPRDFDEEHPQLSEDLALLIVDVTDETIQNFEDKVRSAIQNYAISWTLCRKTLTHVLALLEEAELEQPKETAHRMKTCLTSLCSPCAWPFLQQRRPQTQGSLELAQIEKDFDNALIDPPSQEIPRPRAKERFFSTYFQDDVGKETCSFSWRNYMLKSAPTAPPFV